MNSKQLHLIILILVLLSGRILAADGDIDCEGTFSPSCCTAVSDGASVNHKADFVWTATKDTYEATITAVHWTIHHCGNWDQGSFTLRNTVFPEPNGPAIFTNEGGGYCSLNSA